MRNSSVRALLFGCVSLLTLSACGGGEKADSPPAEEPAAVPASDQGSPEYLASIEEWRKGRVERLQSDTGWLTVAGFYWLKEGNNSFGSAPGNVMVFPEGACPENAGVLRMRGPAEARTFEIVPAEGVDMQLEDETFTGGEVSPGKALSLGRLEFWIIERGGNPAVRLRDPESPLRAEFTGIDYYPIRESYRVTGHLERFDPPQKVQVPNVMGYVDSSLTPGTVSFTLEGKELSLIPLVDDPADTVLFFVFEDATSGGETYGGGRFLYSDLQPDGSVVLDFNKAYNPPCAFNEHTTCSLPPEGNKLPIALRVGEKAYAGTGPG